MTTTTDRPDLVGDGWDPEPLMTAKEVARALAIHASKVYDLPIPRVRVRRKALRWKPADVRDFIDARTETA